MCSNIINAGHYRERSGCGHFYDVGVVCTNEDLPGEVEWMWVSRGNFSVQ